MNDTSLKRYPWVPAVYWSLTLALYLLVSFFTRQWQLTWIIPAVAALLYGALYAWLSRLEPRHWN